MSRILAVETATRACSAALLWDGECREVLRLERNRHAELLIPMARELLARAGCGLGDLHALAFGSGPGSFTGLRIGISVVQGLALGAGLPVVAVSSLLALAARAGAPRVLATIDARMEQVYWNTYRRGDDGAMRALDAPRVSDPESVRVSGGEPWTAVGSGCDAYRTRLSRDQGAALDFVPGVHPHAGDVAITAAKEHAAGRSIDAGLAAPEYVRNEVVQSR